LPPRRTSSATNPPTPPASTPASPASASASYTGWRSRRTAPERGFT